MKLLRQKEFVIHHVGGRGGVITLPLPEKFYNDVCLVLYEADESACSKIGKKWPNLITMPKALSNIKSSRIFNLNLIPSSNSFFLLNPKEATGNQELGRTDVENKRCFIPIEQKEIVTTTIDDLVKEKLVQSPCWLGLDVQGAELEILQGSRIALSSSIVALDVEVSFRPLYKGSPLFFEVDQFLTSQGFVLADISLINASQTRTPFVARGAQVPYQGNALYLLDTNFLDNKENENNIKRLFNLAFVSCLVGQIEIAYEALVKSGIISQIENAKPISQIREFAEMYLPRNIASFLIEFASLCVSHPDYPPLWDEIIGHKRAQLGPASGGFVLRFLFQGLGLCYSLNEFKHFLASKKMERLLLRNELSFAADRVKNRRKQFFKHIPADLYYAT